MIEQNLKAPTLILGFTRTDGLSHYIILRFKYNTLFHSLSYSVQANTVSNLTDRLVACEAYLSGSDSGLIFDKGTGKLLIKQNEGKKSGENL